MNIALCLKVTVPLGVLLCLASGCANVGRDFKYQGAGSLELGQTRSSDYQAMFGKPNSVELKSTADGKFELVRYLHAHANLANARVRLLDLEFRDGVLNSYQRLSTFDQDKTTVLPDNVAQIQRAVSKKDDVLRTLGTPHGKARCPSYHADFKDKCSKGTELWVWTGMDKVSTLGATYGGAKPGIQSIFVVFDKDGVVTAVESSQVKNP